MRLALLIWLAMLGSQAMPASLAPTLLLTTPDQPIRDMTVASDGSIFTYDYDQYRIRRFDAAGRPLAVFGGTGSGEGQFAHLTGIHATGTRLLAIDSVALLTFDLGGRLVSRTPFASEVTPSRSVAFDDGRYVGLQIVAAELRAVLTLRSPNGQELDRIASHDLREFFPALEPGQDFFLSDEYARRYLYTIGPGGRLYWAPTDALQVSDYHGGRSQVVVRTALTPTPLPDGERTRLLQRQSRAKPPFHVHVPTQVPLLSQLAVDGDGDLWVYVQSRERTGFMRYSSDGRSKGFATVSAEFDVTKAVVRIFGRRMFFIAGKELHVAELPGHAPEPSRTPRRPERQGVTASDRAPAPEPIPDTAPTAAPVSGGVR